MDWKRAGALALSTLMAAACGTAPTRQDDARRAASQLPDVTVTDGEGCRYIPNTDKSKEVCLIDDFPLRPR